MDVLFEIVRQFLFRDTADGGIFIIHGDVLQVVEVAEYADLAELRHAGQQGKADVGVFALQHAVEGLQLLAVGGQQFFVFECLQQGLVILVYQDHDVSPVLFGCFPDDASETEGGGSLLGRGLKLGFPLA